VLVTVVIDHFASYPISAVLSSILFFGFLNNAEV
jgi:hypothetical protein